MHVRPAAVAGSFYPDEPAQLSAMIDGCLQHKTSFDGRVKAIIAPHAGYIYSGTIAAMAYNCVKNPKTITRVVLLGPAHRVGFAGLATPGCEYFATPLGSLPVDLNALALLDDLPYVHELPEAHRLEHSLEVHLPFLQTRLPKFSLLPLVVGDATPQQVAAVLERLWGGDETLVVISSDLSHFHSYQQAQVLDAQTTQLIESYSTEITGEQACGCRAINGLLLLAANKQLKLKTLQVKNSGDTAGSKDSVVGYGAYAIY